jgi:hypothetical protein
LFVLKINKRTEIVGIFKGEKKVKEVTSMEAHQCLDHMSQQFTKDTAKQLEWYLKDKFVNSEDCDMTEIKCLINVSMIQIFESCYIPV